MAVRQRKSSTRYKSGSALTQPMKQTPVRHSNQYSGSSVSHLIDGSAARKETRPPEAASNSYEWQLKTLKACAQGGGGKWYACAEAAESA